MKCFALTLVAVFGALVHTSECQCNYGCFCSDKYVVCYPSAQLFGIPAWSSSLKRIYISGSNLPNVTESDFKRFTLLEQLSLPNGNIMYVSPSTFAGNNKMEILNLENNKIAELEASTFTNLTSLRRLTLDSNDLVTVQSEAFLGLEKLNTLSMKNNQLVTLSSSVFKPLSKLNALELSGNPLKCNCSIAWMIEFPGIIKAQSSPQCRSPASLAGRDITTLSYEELGCVAPQATPTASVVQGFRGDQNLELSCVVSSDPAPEVTWYREGAKITSGSQDYTFTDNDNLLIVFMQPELAGEFRCVAENPVGIANAIVILDYAGSPVPVIHTEPSGDDTHVFVGSSFFLPCETDGLTDTYQWMRDGIVLSSNSNFTIETGVGLHVLNAGTSNSGVYTCVASNDIGSVNISAVVVVTDSVITCDGIFSRSMIRGFREKVDLAFSRTQQELLRSSTSPGSLLHKLRFPESGIIEHLKAAEVFDQIVTMLRNQLLRNSSVATGGVAPDLSECELEVLGQLSGCEEHQKEADCSSCYHQKYRSIDGSCNNLDNPLQGAAEVPFVRLLTPAYEDGVGLPVGWSGGKPSARLISRDLISANEVTGDEHFTLMLMQFGQFLDHDMDLAPSSPSNIVFDIDNPDMLSSCSDICDNDSPCFPIPVPDDDPRINRPCMSFTRSSAVCGTGASSLLVGNIGIHREQVNAITSYVDGSMIYGSIEKVAGKLREKGETGKLLEGVLTESGKRLLVFDNESLIECTTGINVNRSKCFLGGDVRTNEQVGLTSMHTIFYREHNRIVALLTSMNPHWDGEKLYQEARRIVIAEWQHIVFTQYLPKIVGASYLGSYGDYDAAVDATIANAFATAAFRFGHSQIMPLFQRLDSDYNPLPIGPLKLQDAFFAPFRILEEGGVDPLIRGLIASPVKMRLSHQGLNNNLTEALFQQAHEIGLDLAALNIQRGRDHGLPNYNKWRSYCNLSTANTIEDLQDHISNSSIRSILRDVYGDDPNAIDLWVGGLLEDTLPNTQLGPTFQCIIGGQFRRLRDGDRFFYERQGEFTPDQLIQIKQASLSRVICDNADDIHLVPMDAFVLQKSSEFVSCNDLPTVDLTLWKDCQECEQSDSRVRRSALFKSQIRNFDSLMLKMSEIEEKIGICKFNGAFYDNGDSWNWSSCVKCHCQDGAVHCEEECVD